MIFFNGNISVSNYENIVMLLFFFLLIFFSLLIVIGLQGKISFISEEGILQLNNFIFALAIMQIVYSFLTMALGRAKVCLLLQFNFEANCMFTFEYFSESC